ncbi:hypothetical protein HG535_0F01830 [Zygotorulaspora mrakii]|uniref:Palmitoyltransferase n=1 Tax=Zygotorulaspora mrakii TaxID=42260 RepID=A0A7H9B7G4_ZYGMR|nr:uncharacterized protein HG535_0F01830 [Zygotorulaspora mrakii]QLG73672.1 hypothetical protein HG535_0F01830 [Zygotorulaspora mrakii]
MGGSNFHITVIFPRCLVSFLYCWTAYVTLSRAKQIPQLFARVLIFGYLLLGLYTYFKLIWTSPGSPLDFPELRVNDIYAAEMGGELPPEFLAKRSITSKNNGRFRLCRTCSVWKPDRCHHCSSCNRCILKMDHHCPWIPGCIGFGNQKYFIQFLIYSTLYATAILVISSAQFYMWFHDGVFERELIDMLLLSVWLLAFAISIAMMCFSVFSILQVNRNQTTIEMYGYQRYREELAVLGNAHLDQDDTNAFDLGSRLENWTSVMGSKWVEWLLPIQRLEIARNRHSWNEKGLFFELGPGINDGILETLDLQNRLLRRVTPRSSIDNNK